MADTGAESRGKGAVGPSHPKARFVPKGLGLEKGGGGGGSRVSWGDRRGRRGSHAPGGRHAGGGRKGCQEQQLPGEATRLGPTSSLGESPGQGWKPRPGDPGATATHTAGLGFVARGVESGRKRMTKLLGVWVWGETCPWAVWREETIQRGLGVTHGESGNRGPEDYLFLPQPPPTMASCGLFCIFQVLLRVQLSYWKDPGVTRRSLPEGSSSRARPVWGESTREKEALVRAGGPGHGLQGGELGPKPAAQRQAP